MSSKIFTMTMRLFESSTLRISAGWQPLIRLTPFVSLFHDLTGHSRHFPIDIPLRFLSLMGIPFSIRKQRTVHA